VEAFLSLWIKRTRTLGLGLGRAEVKQSLMCHGMVGS
jgi:hypothetical protein